MSFIKKSNNGLFIVQMLTVLREACPRRIMLSILLISKWIYVKREGSCSFGNNSKENVRISTLYLFIKNTYM